MYHIVLPVTKIEARGLILANPLENNVFLQLRNSLSSSGDCISCLCILGIYIYIIINIIYIYNRGANSLCEAVQEF